MPFKSAKMPTVKSAKISYIKNRHILEKHILRRFKRLSYVRIYNLSTKPQKCLKTHLKYQIFDFTLDVVLDVVII